MSERRRETGPTDHDLVAYALGELEDADRERLGRRLSDDASLRAQLADVRATVIALSQLPSEAWDGVEPPPPPPLDLPARASATPAAPTAGRRHGRRRRVRPRLVLRPLTAALAAVAFVGIGLGAGLVAGSSWSGPASAPMGTSARLVPVDAADPAGRAVFRLASDRRSARLEVNGLAPTDTGHVYELWLMDSPSDLISIATFRVDSAGRAQLTMAVPTDPQHFRYLDVSLQPLDGTARHSSVSVLRGTTT